ncbi:MAG: hypothetical protein R6U55_06825 [Desulfovermiculus sp.]
MPEETLSSQVARIKEIRARVEELHDNSLGIQAIEANARRILASVYMLEMNLEAFEIDVDNNGD